ncbi:hypothetical protein A3F55_02970 [Candidatus Adlerbacteria bacterium RIFCSPHIGHO2_12_FULL_53_18]|uniref:Uncharacterized protein n=1 Tax=Candidatus Adlerbacteria bacterium RIFCSPHIGHO2_12_FULL_53_18 TaxID=1797242 RepID=A0A1F4XT94_9BACT|nr:MAG: hypothetical protein A3F55_02970 [Candidatus Adlerbacteria bacterium RIFCSPHIGHO2_12_FULL_53_18]
MQNVDFLNLEYIILRVYELVTGLNVDVEEVPYEFMYWGGQIILLGFTLSVIFLAFVVYTRIRIVFVEHEGFGQEASLLTPLEEPELEKGNSRWETIVMLAASPQESDWRRAIIEADVMLGDLLTSQGYRGATIGDQLKDANPLQFTTLDLAWKAHKMRNDVAHGGEGLQLTERDVRATIDQYGRVFEEFNYI